MGQATTSATNEDGALEARLTSLEEKLDRLTNLVESNLRWQRHLHNFVDEMTPVAKSVMDTSIIELDQLEKRGFFAFGHDLRESLSRSVEGYEVGSLPELADSFGNLIAILRLLHQTKVLAAVSDVGEEFLKSTPEPIELLGAAKRFETERDLQRGLGLALDLLSTLGRSVSRAPRLKSAKPSPRPMVRQRSAPAATAAPTTPKAPVPSTTDSATQFPFVSDLEWNRSWAEAMAQKLELSRLDETMWRVIEFSRNDYKANKKAPNIRRITTSLGISTKEVYALFPSAPGPTISKIAGVPKPAGCL